MNATRGNGLLEGFLSSKRAKLADRLIPDDARLGRILDIGCGTTPYFLEGVVFREKHGVDQVVDQATAKVKNNGICLEKYNIGGPDNLPYDNSYFNVVTMLAVIEHIEPDYINNLLVDISRVLKSNGLLIITTPSAISDNILKAMAKLGLVSKEEIGEHKDVYDHHKVIKLLVNAGFTRHNIRYGYFEARLNMWFAVSMGVTIESADNYLFSPARAQEARMAAC